MQSMYHISMTLCPNYEYRAKTGNNISEFTHSNWITCLTIQVLNIRVWFLNIWYTSLTSIHSNLEHGLAILTESFSIGRSKEAPGMCTPLGVQILSFSCSFWQKNCKIIALLGVGAPSSGKSWIRHWSYIFKIRYEG